VKWSDQVEACNQSTSKKGGEMEEYWGLSGASKEEADQLLRVQERSRRNDRLFLINTIEVWRENRRPNRSIRR